MTAFDQSAFPKLRLGASSCLLGEEVRFDGGHKQDRWILGTLSNYVDWVAVCPEVEIGLSVPRPSLRLVDGAEGEVRLVMPKTDTDYTEPMRSFADERVEALSGERLSGYILKSKSPSCGMARVRLYNASGMARPQGRGLFAEALMRRFPALPVEEEGRLHDARIRENFIARIFAYQRWRGLEEEGLSRRSMMRFHQHHKMVLMAHNQAGARRLGHLLGTSPKGASVTELAAEYLVGFTDVMRRLPTTKNHTNVLQHLQGHVSDHLDGEDRRELTELIADYLQGLLPLIVPMTLLRHYARRFDITYLGDQVYLHPHPYELMLLNHV